MRTVAILEGWAGGPKLSKIFRHELANHDFEVIDSPKAANIVVAHSTGCYFLPGDMQAKLVMLINPPYWPGQSIITRFIKMSSNESRLLIEQFGWKRLITDRLLEVYYFLAKPLYTYSVIKNQSHLDFLDKLSGQKVLLIRNENDEFCSPKIKEVVSKHKNIRYLSLPGYHSDYYTNPRPYIDLLLKEYN